MNSTAEMQCPRPQMEDRVHRRDSRSQQNVKGLKKTIAVLLIIDRLVVCEEVLEFFGIFMGRWPEPFTKHHELMAGSGEADHSPADMARVSMRLPLIRA